MNPFSKIREHLSRMKNVWNLHGPKAVFGIYLSKIPFFQPLVKTLWGQFLVKTRILGSIMYLNVFDLGLHRKLLLKGIREVEHVNQIKKNVKPGMTGIEIGANIGYFGLLEARLVGEQGVIYCIEPEPNNLKLLEKNVKANKLGKRMKIFKYLIGDHSGLEKLYLSEFANIHSLSSSHPKANKGFIEIPMVTLDSFIEENNLKPENVDFLRMDIEGYEVMAFQGMTKLLSAKSPLKIFMEFHPAYYPEWGWTFEKFLRYLDSFGFKIREVAKGREFDSQGNLNPLILKNPSIEEVLAMQVKSQGDGSQAFLEKTI